MARGPKGFSEEEKEELKNKLCQKCEEVWSVYGYKKTSVGELTNRIGIATGTFYLLFSSKEELFCETLRRIQSRLKNVLEEIINKNPGITGFKEAMIWLYKEYRSFPFLYDFNAPDYLALINRLSKNEMKEFEIDSLSFLAKAVKITGLELKIEEDMAYAILSTLLYTVSLRERSTQDDLEVYEFLLECTLENVFFTNIVSK